MDAIFVDRHGNKKNFLYQYDHGQFLVIENFEYDVAPKVQYSVSTVPVAISTSSTLNNGVLTASIPDSLLCVGYDMIAYLYMGDETKGQVVETVYISVRPRKRPANFVYPSELFTLADNIHSEISTMNTVLNNSSNKLDILVKVEQVNI